MASVDISRGHPLLNFLEHKIPKRGTLSCMCVFCVCAEDVSSGGAFSNKVM